MNLKDFIILKHLPDISRPTNVLEQDLGMVLTLGFKGGTVALEVRDLFEALKGL